MRQLPGRLGLAAHPSPRRPASPRRAWRCGRDWADLVLLLQVNVMGHWQRSEGGSLGSPDAVRLTRGGYGYGPPVVAATAAAIREIDVGPRSGGRGHVRNGLASNATRPHPQLPSRRWRRHRDAHRAIAARISVCPICPSCTLLNGGSCGVVVGQPLTSPPLNPCPHHPNSSRFLEGLQLAGPDEMRTGDASLRSAAVARQCDVAAAGWTEGRTMCRILQSAVFVVCSRRLGIANTSGRPRQLFKKGI